MFSLPVLFLFVIFILDNTTYIPLNWEHVHELIGSPIQRVSERIQGPFHSAYRIQCDACNYFVKICTRQHYLESEAKNLKIIQGANTIRVPEVVALGCFDSTEILVMEHLNLQTSRASYSKLAEQLGNLHTIVNLEYGLEYNNFIGATPQTNTCSRNWHEFFELHRLEKQLDFIVKNTKTRNLFSLAECLIDELPNILKTHNPRPSLLHGDLWHGNIGFIEQGVPVIFDPAVYYGDREADIAMTRLFGGFPSEFYEAYLGSWPLPSGWELRETVYNIYHILNHINLFGYGYLDKAEMMIRSVLSEIR